MNSEPPIWRSILARTLSGLVGLALFTAVWFGLAGRLDWIQGWALLLFFLTFVSALSVRMAKLDPDLIRERNQPSSAAEPWDRWIMAVYSFLLLGMLSLASLDGGRFQWSAVSLPFQLLGWTMLFMAGGIVWHVTCVNAYLSSWARLQGDRGQVVVKTGLYAFIRHPMYFGVILFVLGTPLVLGSWFAIGISLLIAALFIYRTAREDRMLLEGLEGYQEYSRQVRYRLLPGIW